MTTTSPNLKTCDQRFIVSDPGEVLDRLQRPDADVVVVPQSLTLDLDAIRFETPTQSQRSLVLCEDAEEQIANDLRSMGIVHRELSIEMTRSVLLFAEMFRQHRLDVRYEVTDEQSCPKFHCDNVFVRMLVTYFGPTTEFIEREMPDSIYRVPLQALVFLKGHKHPTYQHRILHRSPLPAKGEKRFCMVVNFYDWLPTR